jgi:cytochrome b561
VKIVAAPNTYSKTQIALHWIIAAMVFFQLIFNEGIEELWEARTEGSALDVQFANPHVVIGIVIAVLVLWRIWLRLSRGAPPAHAEEPPALRLVAAATHILFYTLLLLMPLSGGLAWFGGVEQAARFHGLLEKVLIPLIALHVAGALAQHFIFRSNALKRIFGMG